MTRMLMIQEMIIQLQYNEAWRVEITIEKEAF